jgi:hypothetical protein
MATIHRAADIQEAVHLANRFKEDGTYDLFRGQTQEWAPHSSLIRKFLDPDKSVYTLALKQLEQFALWVSKTPGLGEIAKNDDAMLAVAQHYGIPTPLLDFSRDPGTAGFFASDAKKPLPEGTTSCIYCLNWADLEEMWADFRTVSPDLSELRLVDVSVSGLWRLEAQSGVFIFCRSNWDTWYDLDRISFPHSPYIPYPTRAEIYPEEKSALEILLDQYFAADKNRESAKNLMEMMRELAKTNPQIHFSRTETPIDRLHGPELTVDGKISADPSWIEADNPSWLNPVDGGFFDVKGGEIRLMTDLTKPPDIVGRDLNFAVLNSLRREPNIRSRTLRITLAGEMQLAPRIQDSLSWLWSGLRGLPYTAEELASGMGNCIQISLLYGSRVDHERETVEKCWGRSMQVEFGARDGSYTRAWVPIEIVKSALRQDLSAFLNPEGQKFLAKPESLFMICSNPRSLFDFRRLAHVFAMYLAPSQVVFRPGEEAFFSPSRLDGFGLP